MYNGYKFTDDGDIEKIIAVSLHILEEIGAKINYPPLEKLMLESEPLYIYKKNERICIKKELAKNTLFATGSKRKNFTPRINACAEIYEGKYLDPLDHQYKEWNEKNLLNYIKLAKYLPNVQQASILGFPVEGYDRKKQPLYEKYYTAKYQLSGKMGGYSVWETGLCESLYQIWNILAEEYKKPVEEIFNGGVYIISPLQLGYAEGEHLMWFRERGLKMFIGCLCSIGMTAPITPAGAISMQLSELMLAAVVARILYGETEPHIWSSLSVADMRTMSFRYGRPEQVLMNNAMCDIAAKYGLKYWGHGGLADAKVPSFEAGVQKTATALAHIMKGQNASVCAGLLSVDEVFSPTQMVLDNELTGYLKRIGQGFKVDEDSLGPEGLEECIFENVPFLGCTHTAEHLREIWEPELFSRGMLQNWFSEGMTDDIKKAEKKAVELIKELPDPVSCISEECEKKILDIIEAAS